MPLRLIVCGLPLALSEMLIEPLKAPMVEGLNVTLILQDVFCAREPGQSLLSTKGALGGVMLLITSDAVPVLVSRTVLVELVVPTAWPPKFTLVVLKDAT